MNKKLLLGLMLLPGLALADVSVAVRVGSPESAPRVTVVPVAPRYQAPPRYSHPRPRYAPPVRVVRPIRHRAQWVPPHWEHRRFGWVRVAGYWR